jgi:hypothetical protein
MRVIFIVTGDFLCLNVHMADPGLFYPMDLHRFN